MTGYPQRIRQLRSLESIPGGNRKIDDIPPFQYLPWELRILSHLFVLLGNSDGESDLSTVISQPSQSVACVQIQRSGHGRKEHERVIWNEQTQAWGSYEGYENQITSGIRLSGTEIAT
jgi:hypothetical protein